MNWRDFKIRGRQRHRTIALINENESCTLECSVLTACLLSSSLIRRGKLTFGVLWKTWTSNNKIWQSLFAFEAEPFTFYCSKISGKVATKNLLMILFLKGPTSPSEPVSYQQMLLLIYLPRKDRKLSWYRRQRRSHKYSNLGKAGNWTEDLKALMRVQDNKHWPKI